APVRHLRCSGGGLAGSFPRHRAGPLHAPHCHNVHPVAEVAAHAQNALATASSRSTRNSKLFDAPWYSSVASRYCGSERSKVSLSMRSGSSSAFVPCARSVSHAMVCTPSYPGSEMPGGRLTVSRASSSAAGTWMTMLTLLHMSSSATAAGAVSRVAYQPRPTATAPQAAAMRMNHGATALTRGLLLACTR